MLKLTTNVHDINNIECALFILEIYTQDQDWHSKRKTKCLHSYEGLILFVCEYIIIIIRFHSVKKNVYFFQCFLVYFFLLKKQIKTTTPQNHNHKKKKKLTENLLHKNTGYVWY